MVENQADAASWKEVGNVLETSGNILEVGSFIARSGNKIDVTTEDADTLFQNIDASLPFVILHKDGYQEPVGYATKFSKVDNAISHKGMMFDNDQVKDALIHGYNSISPVIDYIRDPHGKIVDQKIIKLALVPNPAMNQTKLDITRFAFSAPEVNQMPDDGNTTNTTEPTVTIQGHQVPVTTFAEAPKSAEAAAPPAIDQTLLANIATTIAEGIAAKFTGQIESLQNEIASLKSASTPETSVADDPKSTAAIPGVPDEWIEQLSQLKAENQNYKAQIEKEEKASYTAKLAELRALGQDNPEKLVSHLKDTRSKIETLDAFKVTLVKNASMNSPQTQPLSVEGGQNSGKKPITIDALAKPLMMGNIPPDELEWLSTKMRISPM